MMALIQTADKDFLKSIFLKNPNIDTPKLASAYFIEQAKQDFYVYVNLFAPILMPNKFEDSLHIKILSTICQEHSKNNLLYSNDVVINIPPGHSKTTICSTLYISWLLGNRPNLRILFRTASAIKAKQVCEHIARIIKTSQWGMIFNVQMAKFNTQLIQTMSNGYVQCAPYGQYVTGEDADVIIVDDPQNADGSLQETAMYQDVIEAYEGAISTRNRLTEQSLFNLVIQQRLSKFDLSNYLIKRAEEIKIPINLFVLRMEEENPIVFSIPCKDQVISFSRPAGFLWQPKNELERERKYNEWNKKKYNFLVWSAQYQQNPNISENLLINPEYLQYYEEDIQDLPLITTFITCDLAFATKQYSDRTCICSWGLSAEGDIYLLDIKFDRILSEKIPDIIYEFYQKNKITTIKKGHNLRYIACYAFFIEENQNNFLFSHPNFKQIKHIHKLSRKADSTKEIRMSQALPIIASKCVFLPKKSFFKERQLIFEELSAITPETFNRVFTHDDFCDNLLDAVLEGRNTRMIKMHNRLVSNNLNGF